jgi:sirohydrochlorin cobaltochelatase
MKKGILIVNYGSDYAETRATSTDMFYKEIREQYPDIPVFQSFTNPRIINMPAEKRRAEGLSTVEEGLELLLKEGIEDAYFCMTFLVPGPEYYKAALTLKKYKDAGKFKAMHSTKAAVVEFEDAEPVAEAMVNSVKFDPEKGYILLAHGTADIADLLYVKIQDAIRAKGYPYVYMALLKGKPGLSEAIGSLQSDRYSGEVTIVPFMIGAGYSVRSTLDANTDPFLGRIKAAGFKTKSIFKGVAEYPEFRKIYYDKLAKLMSDSDK